MPGSLNLIPRKCPSISIFQLHETRNKAGQIESQNKKNMNESELKNNWFKTWLDNDYNKLDQQVLESMPSEDDCIKGDKFKNKSKNQIPLNQLLDNIPLAYSPITKQLHVLTPGEFKKISISKTNKSQCSHRIEGHKNCDDDSEDSCVQLTDSNLTDDKVVSAIDSKESDQQNEEDNPCNVWNDQINNYYDQKSGKEETVKGEQCAFQVETSSFSSLVSSLSENYVCNQSEDAILTKSSGLDHDDLSLRSLCSQDSGSACGENSKFFDDKNSKDNKKRGFSGFFTRNVFGWKPTTLTSQGWKIFGRNPSQDGDSFHTETDNQLAGTDSPSSGKKYEDVVVSSSALILHNRPANLPAKSLGEQQKHKLEYEQIVEAAKKKEVKESKKRKKQLEEQLKFEEQLTNASKIWSSEILPKWDAMKNSKKTREMWWSGIPPSVRGKIWKLAIGNELNITHQLYEICVARAQERLKNAEANSEGNRTNEANKESSVELIQLDISRTFPQLCIFQKGGPYYDILHCLLGAYVCYRPDVGYVQGMSFIAAVLILNLEPADAFVCFANLLNRPCHLAFFTLNQSIMNAYYRAYNEFFKENLPKLCQHFEDCCLTPDLYLLDWVYSVYAKAMPLDMACRVWDVFLRDGEEFLFRTALGVLHLHQEKLLKLDFINGAQFLRKLPEDLSADLLFKSIDSVKMSVGKVKFGQVLANLIDKTSPR